jgi:hypothetical protein
MSSQRYVIISEIHPLNRSTNKNPNSPTQKRQVSLRHFSNLSNTALAPPSFPSRLGSSILIDCSSEGSLMEENYARRWTDKQLTNQRKYVT